MATGTVKWFNADKGYGFISVEGGKDVFVHNSGIAGEGYRSLQDGAQVQFDLVDGKNGKTKAANVRILKD
jgi:CspA family cold shock protein